MRFKKALAAVGLLAAATLTLAGCNSGSPAAPGGSGDDAASSETPWEVAEGFTLEGSPTFDKMEERGKVVIGVKEDQPNLGYLDNVTGERSGFDVDIARWIAASLGFDEDQIEYKAIASANREQAIVNGDIDYYVGTYSINDKRKADIDFAGPYFITGQGLLVKQGDTDYQSLEELDGKTVCSATGSTPIQNIKENFPGIKTQEFDLYSACVESLLNGQVDAVTTDQAILIGYAAQDPDNLMVTSGPLLTEEKYGVGLPKGDDVLRAHINDLFTDGGDVWDAVFERNLGDSGIKVEQPEVDAY
ncbi:glutamate ABC transporter substrate-binding protein [Leucobacter ruminantium]|uniref:Glutamate ABC transporter substrate-binding protein n=1 Tax=Leucobacter ruminantium TaxID=1289170 RepID=A0A939LYI7_9MICO|nr:glutamate ABC transporter substrate-binding protein [Leucobacter ruminantium]MBO1805473.1 glutamate ABC transporter substrate-binding protein [Leucobacter ruminantium]